MQIKNVHALMGPNIWLNRPVIEAFINAGGTTNGVAGLP